MDKKWPKQLSKEIEAIGEKESPTDKMRAHRVLLTFWILVIIASKEAVGRGDSCTSELKHSEAHVRRLGKEEVEGHHLTIKPVAPGIQSMWLCNFLLYPDFGTSPSIPVYLLTFCTSYLSDAMSDYHKQRLKNLQPCTKHVRHSTKFTHFNIFN